MAEDYAAKMSRKTDAELLQYANRYTEYREDAVLAALDELERRGVVVPGINELRPQLEEIVRTEARQATMQREAAEQAEAAETAAATGPPLYSPGTITLFSAMFSMIAGGILLGINLRVLRRSAGLTSLVLFMIVYLLTGAVLVTAAVRQFGYTPWLGLLFNLPAILIYTLWFWPRYIGTNTYQSRNWLLPFAVCAAINIGLMYYLVGLVGNLNTL